jgi:hypothetical protein
MLLPFSPLSLKLTTIRPVKSPESMLFVILILSFVFSTICPSEDSFSFHFVLLPLNKNKLLQFQYRFCHRSSGTSHSHPNYYRQTLLHKRNHPTIQTFLCRIWIHLYITLCRQHYQTIFPPHSLLVYRFSNYRGIQPRKYAYTSLSKTRKIPNPSARSSFHYP